MATYSRMRVGNASWLVTQAIVYGANGPERAGAIARPHNKLKLVSWGALHPFHRRLRGFLSDPRFPTGLPSACARAMPSRVRSLISSRSNSTVA